MPRPSPETAAGKLSRAELEEKTREALEERRKQEAEFRDKFGKSAVTASYPKLTEPMTRAELEEKTREALEERRKQETEFRHEFGMSVEELMRQRQERQAAADRQRSFSGWSFGQPKADPSVRPGGRWFGFG